MAANARSARPTVSPATGLRTDALRIGAAGAITAAAVFSQWATLASRYMENVGRVAGELGAGSTTTQDATTAAVDAFVAYTRDVVELPRVSSLRFYNELARLKGDSGARTRRARRARRAHRTSRSPR